MRFTIAGCLALAALSLLLPSAPSYDPWAWVVWGREILSLDLDTTGGPSWKPGPVLLTTLFAPLEEIDDRIPPQLWLVVARAGGLMALVLAFRLTARLAGGERRGAVAAGVVAAIAVATLPYWLRYLAHGNEAPLAVALMLGAALAHLDGRHGRAVLLLFVACLLRPEVFPLLAVAGVLLWRSDHSRAPALAAGLLALAVLWLVPEWIGSGNPLDAGKQAASEPPWSLSNAQVPWVAALERAHDLLGIELELALVAGLAAAVVRRDRELLLLAAVGIAWMGLIVVMTQFGFSGARRYFLPALVIACVVVGVGVVRVAEARPVALVLLVLLAASLGVSRSGELSDEAAEIDALVDDQRQHESADCGHRGPRQGAPRAADPGLLGAPDADAREWRTGRGGRPGGATAKGL